MALFLVHSALESEKDTTVGREGRGGYSGFQVTGMIKWGAKIKTQKIPWIKY